MESRRGDVGSVPSCSNCGDCLYLNSPDHEPQIVASFCVLGCPSMHAICDACIIEATYGGECPRGKFQCPFCNEPARSFEHHRREKVRVRGGGYIENVLQR